MLPMSQKGNCRSNQPPETRPRKDIGASAANDPKTDLRILCAESLHGLTVQPIPYRFTGVMDPLVEPEDYADAWRFRP